MRINNEMVQLMHKDYMVSGIRIDRRAIVELEPEGRIATLQQIEANHSLVLPVATVLLRPVRY